MLSYWPVISIGEDVVYLFLDIQRTTIRNCWRFATKRIASGHYLYGTCCICDNADERSCESLAKEEIYHHHNSFGCFEDSSPTWVMILVPFLYLQYFFLLNTVVYFRNINTTIWLSKIIANTQDDCNITSGDILQLERGDCKFSYSSRLYVTFFILTFNIFIGQIALCCTIDWVGRKLCLSKNFYIVSPVSFMSIEVYENIISGREYSQLITVSLFSSCKLCFLWNCKFLSGVC